VRQATTITLALLLVLIIGAAFIQLVIIAG
jgi:hypothetical protein